MLEWKLVCDYYCVPTCKLAEVASNVKCLVVGPTILKVDQCDRICIVWNVKQTWHICCWCVKQSGNCLYIGKFVSFVLCWISLLLITAVRVLSLQCSCMHHLPVTSMHMSYRLALQLVRTHMSPENTHKLIRIHERFILGVNTLYKLFYFHQLLASVGKGLINNLHVYWLLKLEPFKVHVP